MHWERGILNIGFLVIVVPGSMISLYMQCWCVLQSAAEYGGLAVHGGM